VQLFWEPTLLPLSQFARNPHKKTLDFQYVLCYFYLTITRAVFGVIMIKKLTLTIDDKLIEFAKELSSKNKVSISKMVSEYLTSIQENSSLPKKKLSQKTINLYGIFSDLEVPDKKDLTRRFNEKSYR
jgi:hypothetical protein